MEGTHFGKNSGQSSHGPRVHYVHHSERRPHRHRRQRKTVSAFALSTSRSKKFIFITFNAFMGIKKDFLAARIGI